eukprot:16111709-Heterocapsa_arctica.AAC.1
MAVVVMHKDIAPHRTCIRSKGTKNVTMAELTTDCGSKNCITCKARDVRNQMVDQDFDIESSTAIDKF